MNLEQEMEKTLLEHKIVIPDDLEKRNTLISDLMELVVNRLQDWLVEDINSTRKLDQLCVYYRIIWANANEFNLPRNVDSDEAARIRFMKEAFKFSYEQLAYMFQRSKSTIHDVLLRKIDPMEDHEETNERAYIHN